MDVDTSLRLDRIRETVSKYVSPVQVRLLGSQATGESLRVMVSAPIS